MMAPLQSDIALQMPSFQLTALQPGTRRDAAARLPARAGWQLWVALFAVLSFVLLVSTAATHKHTSTASSEQCVLCVAVADKLADTPAAPAIALFVAAASYPLAIVAAFVVAYAAPSLLPPSRGPPGVLA
jgi:cytochrome c-type biogenesis protein CcmH/NrfG